MKRGPQYDFRVLVWPEVLDWYESPAEIVRLFEGIYNVILNDSMSVKFVPNVDLTRPAPPLPANMDNVTTLEEARWVTLMTTDWAVLPCPPDMRSSELVTSHRLPGSEEWAKDVRVIYVAPDEFNEMSRELDTLADEFNGIYDYKPCSELSGYRVIDFVRTRIAEADFLTPLDKYRLGRGPSPF